MQLATRRLSHLVCSLMPALILILALYGFSRWYDPLEPSGPDLFHAPPTLQAPALAAEWHGFGAWAAQTPDGSLVLSATHQKGGSLSRPLEPIVPGHLFRLRGYAASENLAPGTKPWERGRVMLIYRDHTGRVHWDYPHTAITLKGTQDWTAFEWLSSVPDFATSGGLRVVNQGQSGYFKVKEMSLVRMVTKRSNRWLDIAWVTLWGGVAVWYSRRLGLGSRPAGWLIVLLNVGIVVGMLIPNTVIQATHLEATQAVEHQIDRMTSRSEAPSGPVDSERSAHLPFLRSDAVVQWLKSLNPHSFGHLVMFLAMGYSCSLMFLSGHIPTQVSRLRWAHGWVVLSFVAGISVYAAATELLQVLVLSRSPTRHDWWLNMQGFAMGTLGFMLTHGVWTLIRHGQRSKSRWSTN